MSALERVFPRKEDQCTFIYAVAGYLSHLNEFASKRRSTSLIEYNVGGVAAIVEQLKKLGNEHAAKKMHFTQTNIDELVELLTRAWYIREDGTPQGSRPRSHSQREYYNSELDPSATLGIALAQFLATLEPLVDRSTAMTFNVSEGLLRRYSGFAQTGSEREAHFEDETGDEFYSLLRFFRSLHKMKTLEHRANLAKAQELRTIGNDVFKAGRFGAAIAKYTEALLLDPTNYLIYSNRAAAYTYLNATENAIADLKQAIELKNDFETAWARLGFSYLARGSALESVKAYIRAIELAESNGSLAQYIQKLVESLTYAEQRAISQGTTRDELARLNSGIVSIRNRYNVRTRSTTPTGVQQQQQQQQQHQQQQHQRGEQQLPQNDGENGTTYQTTAFVLPGIAGGDPNQTFQIFADGANGADVWRQTLNLMGNMVNPGNATQAGGQHIHGQPQPQPQPQTQQTQAQAQAQGQAQTQTTQGNVAHLGNVDINDPNTPNILRQALDSVMNAAQGNGPNSISYILQNTLDPHRQAQQQQQSQQLPNQDTTQRSEGHDTTVDSSDDPMDQDMLDPETSVPDARMHTPTPGPQGGATANNNSAGQEQPQNAQSFQNVFLNAIPNAMRQTVGPIIMQSLNNALNGGIQGQGATFTTLTVDRNGQPVVNTNRTNTNSSAPSTGETTGSSTASSNDQQNNVEQDDLDLD